jgi:hypothetical protein
VAAGRDVVVDLAGFTDTLVSLFSDNPPHTQIPLSTTSRADYTRRDFEATTGGG